MKFSSLVCLAVLLAAISVQEISSHPHQLREVARAADAQELRHLPRIVYQGGSLVGKVLLKRTRIGGRVMRKPLAGKVLLKKRMPMKTKKVKLVKKMKKSKVIRMVKQMKPWRLTHRTSTVAKKPTSIIQLRRQFSDRKIE